MRKISFLATLLVVSGCVSLTPIAPSPAAAAIRDADENMVTKCNYVGLVTGSSSLGGPGQDTGRANAQTAVREQAAKLGATHIVWSTVYSSWQGGAGAQGKAYRCAT